MSPALHAEHFAERRRHHEAVDGERHGLEIAVEHAIERADRARAPVIAVRRERWPCRMSTGTRARRLHRSTPGERAAARRPRPADAGSVNVTRHVLPLHHLELRAQQFLDRIDEEQTDDQDGDGQAHPDDRERRADRLARGVSQNHPHGRRQAPLQAEPLDERLPVPLGRRRPHRLGRRQRDDVPHGGQRADHTGAGADQQRAHDVGRRDLVDERRKLEEVVVQPTMPTPSHLPIAMPMHARRRVK